MPIFIRTKQGDNYRIKADSILLRWRVCQWLGLCVHAEEDPSGNKLAIAGRNISHFADISQESIDAAIARQAQGQDSRLSAPKLVIPRKDH